jgi:hypothetical protein
LLLEDDEEEEEEEEESGLSPCSISSISAINSRFKSEFFVLAYTEETGMNEKGRERRERESGNLPTHLNHNRVGS